MSEKPKKYSSRTVHKEEHTNLEESRRISTHLISMEHPSKDSPRAMWKISIGLGDNVEEQYVDLLLWSPLLAKWSSFHRSSPNDLGLDGTNFANPSHDQMDAVVKKMIDIAASATRMRVV